ncbi:tetratricopeptide repeat protein [Pseudenhygromyxa sp. WMMC2535]|uniref:tetratricopeptide repeat protein n=1 Tax=Pseudenhygromyxa sp. WMMC2535 TaxID=2712867 RepID=UPI0015545B33|nr:tetratricopeptide repeat protein [Pseudenhygromyxa sp. WMMC2535]NVB40842.1 tetratricopeptide repeat protein [Pseudenhygromyxa sp. WMMC2535]
MKRALVLALTSALLLPAAACKPKEKEVDIEAEIARNLEEAASNLRNNKVDEAETQYNWVLEQDTDNVGANVGLGKVALSREDYAAATTPLEKAVAANAEDAEAQVSLGRAYAGQEDWAKAAEHLGKAWELDNEKEQYALEYGVALRESGELDKSAEVLVEAAELNPKLKYVYRELARTQYAAKKLDEALRTFMKAQIEWKGDQDAYAGAAMVYEDMGEITKAVDQWSNYIQQDCCSTYSKEVAQPKLAELKEKENAGGEDEG